MNKAIERKIQKIYETVFKKVFTKTNTATLLKGSTTNVANTLLRFQSSDKYTKFAKKFAKELAKQGLYGQKGLWRKFYEAAKKSHYVALPTSFKEYEFKVLSLAIKQNFDMIKSIPTKILEVLNHKYTSTLIEEVIKGKLPRGSFRKELAKHGHKQATLIARTETAKLQTAILENRATQLGSVAYQWLASNDKRTRQSHKNMNDVIVFWRPNLEKPLLDNMRGNAGEFPNCRCSPEPILYSEQLTKSTYKVYDYKTDKVITMTKKDLVNALERGEL